MKPIILFSFVIVCLMTISFGTSKAQLLKDSTVLYVKTTGASNADIGYGVATDASGNSYVGGQFQGTVLFGIVPLVGSTPTGSLVKYSTNGTVLWAKTVTSLNNASILDVKAATDGTVYCVGTFKNNAVFGGGIELTTLSTNTQSFIAQYSSDGVCLQAKKIESTVILGNVVINALSIGSGNLILVTGSHRDSIVFGNGVGISGSLINDNAFIARYNSNLVCNWAKRIRSDFSSYGKDISFDNDGNVVCVGQFADTADIGSGILVGQANSGGDNRSGYIAKYTSDGVGIWIKSFADYDTTDESITGLAVANNTYYTLGTTTGNNVGISPITVNANHSGNEEILVCAISSTGNGLWAKSYGSTNDDKSGRIIVIDSALYISGRIEGQATFGPNRTLSSLGAGDGMIAKLKTTDGSVVWARNFGGAGNEFATSLSSNPVVGLSICGFANGAFSLQGKLFTNAGNNDQVFMLVGELKNPIVSRPIGTINGIVDTLKWTNALGADSVEFQIRQSDTINGTLLYNNTIKIPDSLIALPTLNYGTTYYYRSQSKLQIGRPSGYSNWIPFSVVTLPELVRISPIDSATGVSLQTELLWRKPSSIVDSVLIEVRTDSPTGAIWQQFSKRNDDTVQTLPLLTPNRTYVWRGKTKASNGDTSTWTTWFSFTSEGVLDPKIVSPTDGSVNIALSDTLRWETPSDFIDTILIEARLQSEVGPIVNSQSFVVKDTNKLPIRWMAPELNSRYVWRLRFGSKQLGSGQWTKWYSFRTVLPGGNYNSLCAKISGTISDDAGAPIQNGLVTAWRTDASQGDSTIFLFSDSVRNGLYSINVPEGSYLIYTSSNEYFTKWFPNSTSRANAVVQTVQCQDSLIRDLTVTQNPLASQNLTIRGTVRSKSTNLPLVATVQLLPINNEFQVIGTAYTTTTDASGRYQLAVPALNKYLGIAVAQDHSLRVFDTASAFIEGRFVRSGMTDPSNVNYFLDEIPVSIQNNGIQGRLTDSSDIAVQGNVIAYRYANLDGDTTVTARYFYSASTDTSGNFIIKGVEKGKYKVMSIPHNPSLVPGFYTFTSPYCISNWNNSTTIEVNEEVVSLQKNVISRWVLGDKGAATWTITVLQKTILLYHNGKIVEQPHSTITEPGVIILLTDKDGKVSDYGFTDVNGNASSSSLTTGSFEYEASKVGFLPKKGTIVVTATGIQGGNPVIELERIKKDPISSVYIEDIAGVSVYPNPTKRTITIANMPNIETLKALQIQDIRGKEYSIPFDVFYSEGRIVMNVEGLPLGWYSINLVTEQEVYSHQFIKE
ncbi:MAG: hypothetical protein JNL36_00580 [Candidatus Kapabacteria bacterium]|nr:hypothetical protein [Candidatus Kapabacteria bacterium]